MYKLIEKRIVLEKFVLIVLLEIISNNILNKMLNIERLL